MLSTDILVDDVRSLLGAADPEHVVAGYVSQLLREEREDVVAWLGDGPDSTVLHRAEDLTIVKVVMPPLSMFSPHNHLLWAVVGVVVGREDNTFFAYDGDRLEPTTGASYGEGQVGILPEAVIHGVRNPAQTPTIGLHVYGGDLAAVPAQEWDPHTGVQRPYVWAAELPES